MFSRDISRILGEMEQMMESTRQFGTLRGRDYDGHRVQIVDGDVTEEVLVDGEWMDKREYLEEENDDNEDDYTIHIEVDDGTVTGATIDTSARLNGDFNIEEASFNNGIVDISFETEE